MAVRLCIGICGMTQGARDGDAAMYNVRYNSKDKGRWAVCKKELGDRGMTMRRMHGIAQEAR